MTTSISTVTVQDLLSDADWTRRLAFSLLGDRDAADDVVQETWIAALHTRPDARQSLRPWLARVLRNRAVSHRREHARRAAHHDRAAEVIAETTPDASPERLLGRMQVQFLLAELITALAEPARQTVLLRYYEGLTSEQIGEIMKVPPGTVRRRLKDAIDELRDQLDRRHEGDRNSWRLALLPLGAAPTIGAPAATFPPVHPTAWLPAIAMGVSILGLAAGGALLTRTGAVDKPPAGRGTEAAGPGRSGGGARLAAAALPGALDPCQQSLTARRKELAAAEITYRSRAPLDVLFQEGTPNPAARAALLPELERIKRDDDGESFSLECRTWACRVLVVTPGYGPGSEGPGLLPDIRRDEALRGRLRAWWFLPARPTRDPVSDDTYTEAPYYLALKTPSGARVDGPLPPLDSPSAARPLPRTLAACQSDLEATTARLAYVRRINEGKMTLPERFRESEYDPGATLDMISAVVGALGSRVRRPDVLCRGQACRISLAGATTSDSWRQRLERDAAFAQRISETVVTPEALLVRVHTTGAAAETPGASMLKTARDMFETVDLVACAARAPGVTGELKATVFFPATRRTPGPGAPAPAITIRTSGPVAATPVGVCVQEAMEPLARATPVFQQFQGGSVTFRRTFPLEPDAGR